MNSPRMILASLLIFSIILINLNCLSATVLKRSCGAELTKRIARVCEELGGYNSPREQYQPYHQHHRVKRRVADECCKKVCSDSVISLYCYNSSDKVPRAADESTLDEKQAIASDIEPQYVNDDSSVPEEPTMAYRPIRVGTVAPEYNRIAMAPPLYKMSFYKVTN